MTETETETSRQQTEYYKSNGTSVLFPNELINVAFIIRWSGQQILFYPTWMLPERKLRFEGLGELR